MLDRPFIKSEGGGLRLSPKRVVAVGAAVLAITAAAASKCTSCLENWHDKEYSVSAGAKIDGGNYDTGDRDVKNHDRSSKDIKITVHPDAGREEKMNAGSFEAWRRMDALTNALAKKCNFLPKPDLPNDTYSDQLQDYTRGQCFISRELEGVTIGSPNEYLELSYGMPGRSGLVAFYFDYGNISDDGNLLFSINCAGALGAPCAGYKGPSSPADIPAALRLAEIVSAYASAKDRLERSENESKYISKDRKACELEENARAMTGQVIGDMEHREEERKITELMDPEEKQKALQRDYRESYRKLYETPHFSRCRLE